MSSAGTPAPSPLLYATLGVLGLLAWLVCHPYRGLFHDANLYTLQALARLEPGALRNDVFLHFGSQDRFTLFSPLYAAAITGLGIERAASLLTVLSQAGLCMGGWWLARAALPRWAAAAGIVLLLALPTAYGPMRVFSCVEPFLTPRMAAEALVLGALGAGLRGRLRLAGLLGLMALLLHPVMALAGVLTLVGHGLQGVWRAGRRLRAVGLAAALFAAGIGIALVADGRFDAEWLSIVRARSPYLFISAWQSDDAIRAVTGLLPLVAGAIVLAPSLRLLCRSILLAALAGWLATLLGADGLHAVLVTQLQPWRVEWLVSATSALFLPAVLHRLWQSGASRQCAAVLLAAALIFTPEVYAAWIGLASLGMLAQRAMPARYVRLVLFGSVALCVLAVTWRVASDLEFTQAHYLDAALPLWLRRLVSFAQDGLLPGALLGAALWAGARHRRMPLLTVLLVGLAMATLLVARYGAIDWLARDYPRERIAAFEAWRAQIPPHAQVFWPNSPMSSWVLLQRSHYLSGLQSSGVVYSRDAALELKRRAMQLADVVAPQNTLDWEYVGADASLGAAGLDALCERGAVDYLVSVVELDVAPIDSAMSGRRRLKLYRCAARE